MLYSTKFFYDISPCFGGLIYQVVRYQRDLDSHINIHNGSVMSWHLTYQRAKEAVKLYKEK